MHIFKTIAVASALALAAGGANAAVYYADSVVSAVDSTPKTADRSDPKAALGKADGKFYSLGLGGSLTLGFTNAPFKNAEVSVFEITFGGGVASGHREAAEVYAVNSATGASWLLGVLDNVKTGNTVRGSTGTFDQIRLVDVSKTYFASTGTKTTDGFDVDSVSIAPVPVPAAGVLMLAGLGGFAALRRRKNAA